MVEEAIKDELEALRQDAERYGALVDQLADFLPLEVGFLAQSTRAYAAGIVGRYIRAASPETPLGQ